MALTTSLTRPLARLASSRRYATAGTSLGATASSVLHDVGAAETRKTKKEATIIDAFGALSGKVVVLPERFAALKRDICKNPDKMMYTWRDVLKELESTVDEIATKRQDVRRISGKRRRGSHSG